MSEDVTCSYLLQIAERYHGSKGRWAYEAFAWINATYFGDKLPTPLIQWAITPHGGCLGLTGSGREPVITLHPSLLGGREKREPWGIPAHLLGACFAFDVLLHECMHVSVNYLHGGSSGPTSHNCNEWISEVNRLAPLLGLHGVEAGKSTTTRKVIEGEFTKTGKPATKPVRASKGNIPHAAVARFPYAVRQAQGDLNFYQQNRLPFECSVSITSEVSNG